MSRRNQLRSQRRILFLRFTQGPPKPPALLPKVLDTMGQIFNVKKPGPLRTMVTEAMDFVDHHPSLSLRSNAPKSP